MRNGKIAKLPEWLRGELNERLEKGESGTTILVWLNDELKSRLKVMAGFFDGVPITKQNLSEWRRGGFREWQLRRDFMATGRGMDGLGKELDMPTLSSNLLATVMGHYAMLLSPWDGEPEKEFEVKTRILRGLLRDAALMQRSATQADKLEDTIRQRQREKEMSFGGGGAGLLKSLSALLGASRKHREPEKARAMDSGEKEEAEKKEAVEEVDCSGGTPSQATEIHLREDPPSPGYGGQAATADKLVALPETGDGTEESGLVAPSPSESHLGVGLDSTEMDLGRGVNAEAQTRRRADARARERREGAKNEGDLGGEGGKAQ